MLQGFQQQFPSDWFVSIAFKPINEALKKGITVVIVIATQSTFHLLVFNAHESAHLLPITNGSWAADVHVKLSFSWLLPCIVSKCTSIITNRVQIHSSKPVRWEKEYHQQPWQLIHTAGVISTLMQMVWLLQRRIYKLSLIAVHLWQSTRFCVSWNIQLWVTFGNPMRCIIICTYGKVGLMITASSMGQWLKHCEHLLGCELGCLYVTYSIVCCLWLSASTGRWCQLAFHRSTWSHHLLRFYLFHGVWRAFQHHSPHTRTPSPPSRVAHLASGPCTVGPAVWKQSRQTPSSHPCSHMANWVIEIGNTLHSIHVYQQ